MRFSQCVQLAVTLPLLIVSSSVEASPQIPHPANAATLSFDDALKRARSINPELSAAIVEQQVAHEDRVQARSAVGTNSDMSFDVARKRIYVTGSETASVFEQSDADHYKHIAEVPTAYRAKSSIFVPELKRLYVAVSGKGKPDAKLELHIHEAQ